MPPIERIEDLIAWQLARTLEQQVLAFTANPPASKDGDFCYQIRKSASSAPTNMAEGFGRFWPAEFAYKMRVAIGELEETLRHLDKALDVKYLTEVQHLDLYALGDRAASAAVKFARYLEAAGPDWKKEYLARRRDEYRARRAKRLRELGERTADPSGNSGNTDNQLQNLAQNLEPENLEPENLEPRT
ncbi:MAG TPA: four helix bundle protein [Vicinamibacterales bacterium]|nr:four helix bundle protein [Vicinamibacterales bacterium]